MKKVAGCVRMSHDDVVAVNGVDENCEGKFCNLFHVSVVLKCMVVYQLFWGQY
jgi:hypothetical protein